VNIHFNGAATTAGVVIVEALPPGWSSLYTRVGSAKFVPGQTDVQVQISVVVEKPAEIPLKVLIERSSAQFQTMTHYGSQANFGSHAPGPAFGAGVSGPAVGLDLSGRWFHDGRPTSVSVSPGGSVTITNEQGQTSSGHMSGNEDIVMSSLIRGSVSHSGRRISWSNGTTWTR
jgi:hypothetical protein